MRCQNVVMSCDAHMLSKCCDGHVFRSCGCMKELCSKRPIASHMQLDMDFPSTPPRLGAHCERAETSIQESVVMFFFV